MPNTSRGKINKAEALEVCRLSEMQKDPPRWYSVLDRGCLSHIRHAIEDPPTLKHCTSSTIELTIGFEWCSYTVTTILRKKVCQTK